MLDPSAVQHVASSPIENPQNNVEEKNGPLGDVAASGERQTVSFMDRVSPSSKTAFRNLDGSSKESEEGYRDAITFTASSFSSSSVPVSSEGSHLRHVLRSTLPTRKPGKKVRMERKIETVSIHPSVLASSLRYKFEVPFLQSARSVGQGLRDDSTCDNQKKAKLVFGTDFDLMSRAVEVLDIREGLLGGTAPLDSSPPPMPVPPATAAGAELFHHLEKETVPNQINSVLLSLHFTPEEISSSAFEPLQRWGSSKKQKSLFSSSVAEVERETLASVLSRSAAKASSITR